VLRFRLRTAISALLAASLCLPPAALAHQPKPETLAAYEHYRTLTEARMDADRQSGHFLYFDRFPAERRAEIDAQFRRGEFYLEQLHTLDDGKKIPVPGGLIHHWIGAAFLSGATLAQTKAVLEDYEHQKTTYHPDVRQSRLISEDGATRNVFLQFYSKTIVTAVFNVNFASATNDYSPTQTQVRACSTRVADVEDFGKPEERELAPADSRGYLWQLCTWWHIEEKSGGTYIQVEAIELSRTVPFMFAWIVNPIIRDVPKTFLSHLLAATRKAVLAKNKGNDSNAAPKSNSSRIFHNTIDGKFDDRSDEASLTSFSWDGAEDYSVQPASAICSSMCRASELPFFDAATSNTCAWSQFFSTPSPRRYKSASVTTAGT
jgi:hypothetical protein